MRTSDFNLADCRGAWAVVTGASSGIGRAIALRLARQGIKLAVVGRSAQALADTVEQVQQIGGHAQAFVADLAQPGAPAELAAALQRAGCQPLRLLVNNAGSGAWGSFASLDASAHQQVLAVNAQAVVDLCAALSGALARHTPAAIVNVSSQAAYQPVPYMAVYAASKAFVHSFTLGLRHEMASRGVQVQLLVPGPTATDFDQRAGVRSARLAHRASADSVAQALVAGLDRNRPVIAAVGGIWRQRLAACLVPTDLLLQEVAKLFAVGDGRGGHHGEGR